MLACTVILCETSASVGFIQLDGWPALAAPWRPSDHTSQQIDNFVCLLRSYRLIIHRQAARLGVGPHYIYLIFAVDLPVAYLKFLLGNDNVAECLYTCINAFVLRWTSCHSLRCLHHHAFPPCSTYTFTDDYWQPLSRFSGAEVVLLLNATQHCIYRWVPRGLLLLSPPFMSLDSRSSMESLRTPPRKSYAISHRSWRRKGCQKALCLGAALSLRLPGRVRLVRCMNCWSQLFLAGNAECQVRSE